MSTAFRIGELIETFTVSGSSVQNVDFATTLDGNTDEAYTIEGTMVCGAAFAQLFLQPNGLTTNQRHIFVNGTGAAVTTGGGAGANFLVVPSILDVDGQGVFRAYFYAKVISGLRRWGFADGYSVNSAFNGNDQFSHSSMQWNDLTTNVTSIRLAGDRASAQKAGSVYRLWRMVVMN
jgi:hypothetical protein